MEFEEIQKSVEKDLKKSSHSTFTALSIVALITVIAFVVLIILPIFNGGKELGKTIGETSGNIVGTAIGSFNGIQDIPNAIDEGREQGISAEDTITKIGEGFEETGKLEVLVASVSLEDFHEDGKEYAVLYQREGELVFTVDLVNTNIYKLNNNSINVYIPLPEYKLNVDDEKTVKLAEYEKPNLLKDKKTAYESLLNSRNKTDEELLKTISNYASLYENAKSAAKEQVRNLASTISGLDVEVYFKGGR